MRMINPLKIILLISNAYLTNVLILLSPTVYYKHNFQSADKNEDIRTKSTESWQLFAYDLTVFYDPATVYYTDNRPTPQNIIDTRPRQKS